MRIFSRSWRYFCGRIYSVGASAFLIGISLTATATGCRQRMQSGTGRSKTPLFGGTILRIMWLITPWPSACGSIRIDFRSAAGADNAFEIGYLQKCHGSFIRVAVIHDWLRGIGSARASNQKYSDNRAVYPTAAAEQRTEYAFPMLTDTAP